MVLKAHKFGRYCREIKIGFELNYQELQAWNFIIYLLRVCLSWVCAVIGSFNKLIPNKNKPFTVEFNKSKFTEKICLAC